MGKKGAKVVTKLTFKDRIEEEIRRISDMIRYSKGKIYALETALKLYNISNQAVRLTILFSH